MSSNRFASNQFLFKCPFYKSNSDCPFTELRKLAIEERVNYLRKKTFQDIFNLEYTHKYCLKKALKLKGFISKRK